MGKKSIKIKQDKTPTLVWAFQELDELCNRVGFVTCEGSLATKLLKENKVQDPRIGAGALKHIEYGKPKEVKEKVTKAKPRNTKEK